MFEKDYFQKLYPKGATIDGDFNAKDHAKYLKAFFNLMELEVDKMCDFGVGKGRLLLHMKKVFEPKYIEALDVSDFALDYVAKKDWAKDIRLKKVSIADYKTRHLFDLGLCNSVLQYVPTKEVEASIINMAKTCRYIYFYCPTAEDYEIFSRLLDFHDPYALARPLEFYQSIISRYFKVVGYGLLESTIHKKHESPFLDSFYRL